MEKVIYLLERNVEADEAEFNEQLLTSTSSEIRTAGGSGIQVNVVDGDVARAAGLRFVTSDHHPSAIVSVWLPSAIDDFRAPVDAAVNHLAARVSACVVTESQPIANRSEPDSAGRTPGFAQLAFLHKPQRLSVDGWLDNWLNHHTRVAIDTQATFGYTQNIVTRRLFGETRYDAIVEELFPEDAMVDQNAFYNAIGDDELLDQNRTAMMNSVGRFIDLDSIDVIATSQYRF